MTTSEGVRTTAYAARGNTLSTFRAGVAVAAGYDAHGRLTSYTRGDQADRVNAYNGLDKLMVTTNDAWTTIVRNYVYDLGRRLIDEHSANAGEAIAETFGFSGRLRMTTARWMATTESAAMPRDRLEPASVHRPKGNAES